MSHNCCCCCCTTCNGCIGVVIIACDACTNSIITCIEFDYPCTSAYSIIIIYFSQKLIKLIVLIVIVITAVSIDAAHAFRKNVHNLI